MPDFIAEWARRTFGEDGWGGRVRENVRPWHALPAVVGALTLIAGGFWLGGMVGGTANAGPLTSTIKVRGRVITQHGVQYVKTPARTVKVKGKIVHIPARTVKLPGGTEIVPGAVHTVAVPVTVATTVNKTAVTTVKETITVTGPTQTVNGPTQTVTVTQTVTEPGTTITVSVP